MIRDPSESGQKPAPRSRRKWLATALGLLLLGGACVATGGPGPDIANVAPPRPAIATTSPRFTDAVVIAPDGTQLPLRKWLPKGQPKAVILALHGFGDYSHAFEDPGALWAKRGIATYAFCELRGETSPDIVAMYDKGLGALIAWNDSHPELARVFGCSERPDSFETTLDHGKAVFD